MKPYHEQNGVQIFLGDCRDVLPELELQFDACISDPPYGLGFMGKEWDSPGGVGNFPMRRTDAINTVNTGVSRQGGRQRACEDFARRQARDARSFQEWNTEWAKVLLNTLKPGAMSLLFGGTRTHHRLTCALEDAGFEIRDCLMWLYGSGFPKSLDISKAIDKSAGAQREIIGSKPAKAGENLNMLSRTDGSDASDAKGCGAYGQGAKQTTVEIPITAPATDAAKLWDGYGTALKPAWEPIILAMKPCDGTFAENALEHGVAGLNIDGARIPANGDSLNGGRVSTTTEGLDRPWKHDVNAIEECHNRGKIAVAKAEDLGRWPANLILDEEAAAMFPDAPGQLADASNDPDSRRNQNVYGTLKRGSQEASAERRYTDKGATNFAALPGARRMDSGSAARFFYTAKADSNERGTGNNHPTVKPLDLMRYLCGLLCPPEGGILLDPFMGSGSTIIAARRFFSRTIGIEIDEHYCEIAAKRLSQEVLELT